MSIPRNKLMHNKSGFQAKADVGINSPKQTNTQSVNVILNNSPHPLTKDKSFNILMNDNIEGEERSVELDQKNNLNIDNKPLNDNLDEVVKDASRLRPPVEERSIETAKENLNELQSIIKNKDNLIEALSLILDIYENNPLIVNKVIVSKEDELTRLLFLLTGADSIELVKLDPEVSCCKVIDKFIYINKILIKKGENTYNFKYSYPNVVNLLDNRKISYKICI